MLDLDIDTIKGRQCSCFCRLLLEGPVVRTSLYNRSQRVKVGDFVSSSRFMRNGIPQGSVLGSFLFLLFTNDLHCAFDPSIRSKLFADDAKLYNRIDYRVDPTITQVALNALANWFSIWQINLSLSAVVYCFATLKLSMIRVSCMLTTLISKCYRRLTIWVSSLTPSLLFPKI